MRDASSSTPAVLSGVCFASRPGLASTGRGSLLASLGAALLVGCSSGSDEELVDADAPNVIWIVWDTVRADHMSLYGYGRETTPNVDAWAQAGLVFEDCLSVGSSTIPAHASMLTGLLPTEHGANNATRYLDDLFTTAPELFQYAGYATYLFSANPNIQKKENFQQGFDVEEHPWDPQYRERALEILARKSARDSATGMAGKLQSGDLRDIEIKACGELAQVGLLDFLDRRPGERFFAFLNYMEAHAPLLPPERLRRRFLSEEAVAESYVQDRSWATKWGYTFGLTELPPEWFEVYTGTYDAALAELDELFGELMRALEARGALENTIVVLTADHGEHLGDHHLIDHRYSLYQGLVRVPLVLWHPDRIPAARSERPVANIDLYKTLLVAVGLDALRGLPPHSHDLLSAAAGAAGVERTRVAEYPATFPVARSGVRGMRPDFDPAPFRRRLKSLVRGGEKLIWSADGQHELYDLRSDPNETNNLAAERSERTAELAAELEGLFAGLRAHVPTPDETRLTEEERERMRSLGYLGDDSDDEPESVPGGY